MANTHAMCPFREARVGLRVLPAAEGARRSLRSRAVGASRLQDADPSTGQESGPTQASRL